MVKPSKKSKKKRTQSQHSDDFKAKALRLWETGDYETATELARFLKMKARTLQGWIKNSKTTKVNEGVAVISKLETNQIERFIKQTIIVAQDTLTQLEPKDRANYSMQLLDRLTELRKNVIILPGEWDDGTGIISEESAMAIMSLIPPEGQGAFITALKDAKDVSKSIIKK